MSKILPVKKKSRNEIWLHNALLGQCTRAQSFCRAVMNGKLTTNFARLRAERILGELNFLMEELKKRNDQ